MSKLSILLAILILAIPANAAITTIETQLFTDNEDSAGFFDGRYIYVLGGNSDGGVLDVIQRFDPLTESLEILPEKLPEPMQRMSIVYTGQHAYLFGGGNRIVRYTPSVSEVITAGYLPAELSSSSAAWDGTHAYIFAGSNYNQILKYNPATREITTLPVTLPSGSSRYSTAVWHEGTQSAYIVGGSGNGVYLNTITKYTPSTGSVSTVATLPEARYGMFSVVHNGEIYLFGGYDTLTMLDDIFKFDPYTNQLTTMPDKLPVGLATPSVASTGQDIYIFGGTDVTLGGTRAIVRYTPTAPVTTTLTTTSTLATTTTLEPTGSVVILGTKMPAKNEDSFAFFDGRYAYILDGHSNGDLLSTIIRFDPLTESLEMLPETLPIPTNRFAGAYDGNRYAYTFGGTGTRYYDDIIRYDPTTGEVATMPTKLPTPRFESESVWGNGVAYIYGGFDEYGTHYTKEILKYNPASGELTVLPERLPTGGRYMTAVWDEATKCTYLFGGSGENGQVDEVVRHNPLTGEVDIVARFPEERYGQFAIEHGGTIYVMGGAHASGGVVGILDEIWTFDSSTNTLTLLGDKLTHPLATPSVVSAGEYIYMFGGTDHSLGGITDIMRYSPSGVTTTTLPTTTIPAPTPTDWSPMLWIIILVLMVLGGVYYYHRKSWKKPKKGKKRK